MTGVNFRFVRPRGPTCHYAVNATCSANLPVVLGGKGHLTMPDASEMRPVVVDGESIMTATA